MLQFVHLISREVALLLCYHTYVVRPCDVLSGVTWEESGGGLVGEGCGSGGDELGSSPESFLR